MKSVASTDKFKKLLVNQIPALLRYATALTGNISSAEDLTQDCLERALIKQEQWNSEKKLSTWLHAILHNIFIDQYRRSKIAPMMDSLDIDSAGASHSNPLKSIELQEVERFIAKLPAEQREVLLLVTLMGLDYKTVSEIIDAPVGTVMSRLHRARKSLAENQSPGKSAQKQTLSDEVLEI